MNPYINEILTRNRKTLQALHDCMGFDWCEPYRVCLVLGSFTVHQIAETMIRDGCDPLHDAVAILMEDPDKEDRFYLAAISKGKVDLSVPKWGPDYPKRRYSVFTQFRRKFDFENSRKNMDVYAYIIYQKQRYLKYPKGLEVNYFTDRFLHIAEDDRMSGNKPCSIHIKPIDCNADAMYFNFDGYGMDFYTTEEVIDKSGFVLIFRKLELKKRAARLRLERERVDYVAADHSRQIEVLKSLFEKRKQQLIQALTAAKTEHEYHAVGNELCLGSNFLFAYRKLEQFVDDDAHKRLDNEDAFARQYEYLRQTLEDMLTSATSEDNMSKSVM